jgi:hypothetical protein
MSLNLYVSCILGFVQLRGIGKRTNAMIFPNKPPVLIVADTIAYSNPWKSMLSVFIS